jgi:hypothetical protein
MALIGKEQHKVIFRRIKLLFAVDLLRMLHAEIIQHLKGGGLMKPQNSKGRNIV